MNTLTLHTTLKTSILSLLLLFTTSIVGAQSARVWFNQANTDYEMGANDRAWTKLLKAEELLGQTNPRIESLKAQIAYAQGDIVAAKLAIETYLAIVSPAFYGSDAHESMLMLRKSIDEALERKEQEYLDQKHAELRTSMFAIEQKERVKELQSADRANLQKERAEEMWYQKVKDSRDKEALESFLRFFGDNEEYAINIKSALVKFSSPDDFLFTAVATNDIAEVEHLLDNGGNINYRQHGTFLIHKAVREASLDMVKLLIDRGAEIESVDAMQNTPLLIAVKSGSVEKLQFLLAQGANIEASNSDRNTPVLLTTMLGSPAMLEVLVNHGASLQVHNFLAQGALELAFEYRRLENFQFLLKYLPASTLFTDGRTALYHALSAETNDYLKALLEADAATNTRQPNGWYTLHYAVYLNNVEAVGMLLAHGADPNLKGEYGWTPLHYAAREGLYEVAELLVQKGGNANQRDDYNRSPRHVAREYKHKNLF